MYISESYINILESQLSDWKEELEIIPEKTDPSHSVCSIGYSKKDGKWYGWSHRARFGWKVGDKVTKDTCGNPKDEEWIIKTEEEAKQMAKDFAEDVS